jgi:hypothetical protein
MLCEYCPHLFYHILLYINLALQQNSIDDCILGDVRVSSFNRLGVHGAKEEERAIEAKDFGLNIKYL